jgi:hypothetical protein
MVQYASERFYKTMIITNTKRPTKIQRVFDYMAEGNTLTPGKARSMFKVTNVRATMHDLREAFGRFNYRLDVVRETKNGRSHYRLRNTRRR